jgi:molybdate transport system substrate-binding protein
MIMRCIVAVTHFAMGMILMAGATYAAEIKVLASAAIKTAYLELLPEFERTSGHKVLTTWAPTAEMARRVKDGEIVDLVIMAVEPIDELIKLGRITTGSRVDLAKSGIGVAVRPGAPRPDISSAEALKHALLAAKSITHSTGLSGVYVTGLFQRMGISDELKPKIKVVKGVPIGLVLERGDAEIGFQQSSELLAVKGVNYVGPLPAELQYTIVFSAGVPSLATQPDAARALARFLATLAAAAIIRKTGLEPA